MTYSVIRKTFPFHWCVRSTCNRAPNPLSSLLFVHLTPDPIPIPNLFRNGAYFSKLAMAPLAKTLLDNLQRRAASEEDATELRFGLFLAHDTTVLPLLCAWDVWDGAWPAYAALLAIELYEAAEGYEHYVRLVYGGEELILPGCTEPLCPLERLVELTEPWAFATDDPARPCWVTAAEESKRGRVVEYPAAALGASGVEQMTVRSLPSPSTSSSVPGSNQNGAYGVEGPSPSTSTPVVHASLGATLLALLLGVAVGVVLTLAWDWRQRRRRQEYVGVGSPPGVGGGQEGGGGGVPRLLDRGQYISI